VHSQAESRDAILSRRRDTCARQDIEQRVAIALEFCFLLADTKTIVCDGKLRSYSALKN
jgi:hypothetical protein